jgi:hypothetical protein
MASKIVSGFPIRRCSWSYRPVVPSVLTRRMIRWLDSVCLKRATFQRESDDAKKRNKASGVTNGI